MKNLLGAAVLLASTALTAPASAAVITTAQIGQTGTAIFDSENISGLSAAIAFTLQSVNTGTNTWTFAYSVDNTSTTPSSVTIFGFNTDPNLVNVTATGVFDVEASGQIPTGGSLEFCAKDAGPDNNCTAGQGGVLPASPPATGTLVLDFAGSGTSIALTDFYVRYQSVGISGQLSDIGFTVPGGEPFSVNPVPLPAVGAALPLILGFGGYAAWRKRRKQAAASQLVAA